MRSSIAKTLLLSAVSSSFSTVGYKKKLEIIMYWGMVIFLTPAINLPEVLGESNVPRIFDDHSIVILHQK